MKTLMSVNFLFASLLAAALFVNGCKKDKEEETEDQALQTEMQERAMADAAFDDASMAADEGEAFKTGSINGTQRILTNCASISLDTVSVPHVLEVNFGSTDCLCNDGNYRRGIIHVEWTGRYRDAGHIHTITFINYYVNFNQVTGSKTVENTGLNANGNPEFHITVNGSVIFDAQYGGGTVTMQSDRTREWIAGVNTVKFNDDIYLISGTGSGTTRDGNSYTFTTTTPLKKEIGFPHFTSGVLEYSPSGKPTRIFDFSYKDGKRDNLALLTINGQTRTIILRSGKL